MSRNMKHYLRSIDNEFMEDGDLHSSARDVCSLLNYALNVVHGVEAASAEAEALVGWLSRNRQRLGLSASLFIADDNEREHSNPKKPVIDQDRWSAFGTALTERYLAVHGAADHSENSATQEPASIEAGLRRVSDALGFDALDAALFGVIFHYRNDNAFERLFDALTSTRGRAARLHCYPDLFALLVGAQTKDVNYRFRADAQLRASGAISVDEDGDISLAARLKTLVDQCAEGDCDVRTELLGMPLAARLPWAAFRHLGHEVEIAADVFRRVIQAAQTDKPELGVHILLYGPPGTGKTECARSLAEELGVSLHVVGEQSDNGQEPSRSERLSSLLLAQRIGAGMPSIYLFDEAEDLFRPSTKDREPDPKIFVHRLLETARVPMVWAANDLDAFSPAVLRRMTMCIEVRLPNQARRAELWQELAKEEKVTLDTQTAGRLARLIPSAPSVARTALRAARLADGTAETVALVASGMARAIGHGRTAAPEPEIETRYDPVLSNADGNLSDIIERLARPGIPPAVSLLLSGPPGTGKTAFARHLAGRLGLEVLQKRGSDLFGPFVGETEANIAAAFAEARATGAFLLFDEADSLLFDRSNAIRGWELSQVNEMLTWMEQHPLPFACTTNLAERLDKASLRRFLVRLNFDFLRPDQAAFLFRRTFNLEPPSSLARLDRLTPADFSRIARRCLVLGLPMEARALLDMLAAEIEGRDVTARPIGFAQRAAQ
jgi:transitional endoplasmic reticulum ATPase